MGCSTSKLDNLPAVALCRDRCRFLEEALRHSYALADAHVAYMQSLKTLGPTLHQFFDHFSSSNSNHHRDNDATSSSNGDHAAKESISSPPDRSPSSLTSDSHIQFDTDSEEEERIKDFQSSNRIHPDYFNLDTSSSSYRFSNYSTYNAEFNAGDWPAHNKTPPPPTPSSSAWDFLNFFEPLEKYEPAYIPESESKRVNESKQNHDTISISAENDKVGPTKSKKEVPVSENKRSTGIETKVPIGQPGVSEVLKEVQVLFEKASESGNDVLKMFDAGKFRYHHKYYSLSQVSSKMFKAVAPSKPLRYQRLDDDDVLNSRNLTASLRKLCMWERKLYDEVKAEEKLRILYARKYKQMKSLDDKGAETLEAARTMLRALSTKIQIAFHVIDKMSISMNKLRDEELWPQINDLVHRLLIMWKAMLECHRRQSHIIMEAKSLDAIASNAKLENHHLEAAIKLKFELQNWYLNFSDWNEAQKGYVKALNGWLLKCLAHEPEEPPDGRATFSPGRIGAPAVFVISHHWLQAMGMLPEKEVAEALQSFCSSINQLLEQHHVELQQMAMGRRDVDRKLKILEREEKKMQKAMQEREKKMTSLAREWNKITSTGSLHSGLKQSFMAIERFAANSEQAYDELHLRIEEGKFT